MSRYSSALVCLLIFVGGVIIGRLDYHALGHVREQQAYLNGINDMACITGVKEKCPTAEQLKERFRGNDHDNR